ncbi:MAG TPA: thiosulfate oxidation carrier complex protein SoxZ [Azoarcus taiwanensis]|nr:thiosulfate oxidation carrier complex protein SoxZ [Azoarcus taiwanensis]
MADPILIRAAVSNGITEIRMRLTHPMETGQRTDAAGGTIPAHFITRMTVEHNDRVLVSAHMAPSIAADPLFTFRFRGGASGDSIRVSWLDNRGETRSDDALIR